jgi:hypothetical protein
MLTLSIPCSQLMWHEISFVFKTLASSFPWVEKTCVLYCILYTVISSFNIFTGKITSWYCFWQLHIGTIVSLCWGSSRIRGLFAWIRIRDCHCSYTSCAYLLKGHWHEKSVSTKHGGFLISSIWTANIFLNFLIIRFKAMILNSIALSM